MLTASKELVAEVIGSARTELVARGYKKRSDNIFTRDLGDEMIGWVGLNRAVRRGDGLLHINPVVGVRHQPVEKALADVTGQRPHSYIPPTVSAPLGYLMPERRYRTWSFRQGGANAELVHEMVNSIVTHGQPFMEANSSLAALCETLAGYDCSWPEQTAYRLPLAYFLAGRIPEASGALDERVKELGERIDPAAQSYRAFAAELGRRF